MEDPGKYCYPSFFLVGIGIIEALDIAILRLRSLLALAALVMLLYTYYQFYQTVTFVQPYKGAVRAKVDKALSKDEGRGIIRIARDKMEEGNFKVGMKVIVYKSWLETLKLAISIKTSRESEWVPVEAPELIIEDSTVLANAPEKSEKRF